MAAIRTIPFMLTAVLALAGVARAAPASSRSAPRACTPRSRSRTRMGGSPATTSRPSEGIARRAGWTPSSSTPWDSIFLGLESRKYDLVANQIGKTPEREKKYLFTDDYLVSGAQIIVKRSRRHVHRPRSLAGLKVGTGVGSNYSKLLEAFNASHSPGIEIKYYEGTSPRCSRTSSRAASTRR